MVERWIVDAMNVIGSKPDGWWKDRRGAMGDLARRLDRHAAEHGRDITVVFDSDPGALSDLPHLEVVIAAGSGRNAADREIQHLVKQHDDASRLRVVTSDRALAESVREEGAVVVSSGSFRRELEE